MVLHGVEFSGNPRSRRFYSRIRNVSNKSMKKAGDIRFGGVVVRAIDVGLDRNHVTGFSESHRVE